jgi:glycosyltransferase involved in cell wall biosynthesis
MLVEHHPRTEGCESTNSCAPDSFPPDISVIIPAKDESNSIGELITRSKERLLGCPYEIIVVDDGSEDETSSIASYNGAITVSHETNLGKGATMMTGARNARGSIIVFLDGDGAHDPKNILGVIEPILYGEADLVIGSRALPGSEVETSPLMRKLGNHFASFTISAIVSYILPVTTLFKCRMKYIKITDCTSGFRAISKDAWDKLDLVSKGFEIETEMIYEAARKNLEITEVPISCNWDPEFSRLNILQDGLKTVRLLTKKLSGNIIEVFRRPKRNRVEHFGSFAPERGSLLR